MRKWILLSILAIGMLFVLAGCAGCSLTKAPGSTNTSVGEGDCTPTNTDGAETIAIAGATFKMGSLATDVGASADEQPQHEVTLGCYNIYKKEVTNAMFNQCVATGACVPVQARDNTPTAHINDPAFADYPVTGIDYNMASEYCTWAGARLPTEAEWEYAARGSKILAYPWGSNTPDCTLANSKGCLTPEDTKKVGLLSAGNSPFGLFDMAGNAWEWVFDWYAANGYSKSASTDPIGPATGFWKVVRGGGYNSLPAMLRAANRHAGDPYQPYYNVGFRCVTGPFTATEGYVPPNPNLHNIPLDGPVDDDDPGNPGFQVQWGISPANCPDGNGKLHFDITLLPHADVTLVSFNVDDGADFNCTWDDGSQLYHCVGPDSPALNPNYTALLCTHIEGQSDICLMNLQIPRAQNCDSKQYPFFVKYSLDCPQGGFIKATFSTDPVLTWDITEIDGGVAMACVVNASNELVCMAQDVPLGGPYVFHLTGKDASNAPHEISVTANPNPNCPQGNKDFKGILFPTCMDTDPFTTMNFVTDLPGDPILEVGGVAVPLFVTSPGWAWGALDPALQGMTVPYAMGINPDMLSFGTVYVPVCEKSDFGFFNGYPYCDGKGNSVIKIVYTPASQTVAQLTINNVVTPWVPDTPGGNTMTYIVPLGLWGQEVPIEIKFGNPANSTVFHKILAADGCSNFSMVAGAGCENGSPIFDMVILSGSRTLQAMKINGDDYDITQCSAFDPGHYHCPLPTSLEGWTFTVEVQADGQWSSGVYFFENCGQTSSCICRITAPDCLSTSAMGFTVDTCVKNPVALVAQSVTATDGTTSYDCVVTGAVGSAYCGGTIPATSGPLTVCFVQQGSQAQKCCSFPNFANSIPSCVNWHPEPTGCSQYKNEASCVKAGCTRVLNPFTGAFEGCE